jgi:outer membrane protein OmpA-like peptidoglycan-associated protein
MKHKQFLLISTGLLLANATVLAQKNEFSLYAGGGMHGLHYDNNYGGVSIKPGFQAGLGYTRFLSSRWGIRTGLEIGYYHSRATLHPGSAFTSNEVDSEGQGFEYRVKMSGYQEDQKLYTINIPLQLQFQTPVAGRRQFYALAGGKMGLPLTQRYTTQAASIETSGYYPHLNIEIKDLPVHGFGQQTGWNGKGDYDLKISLSLAVEAGMRFHITSTSYLHAGAYLDYGLHDIRKGNETAPLLAYNPNGLNQSKATGLFTLPGATSNIRLLAYGIKLGLAFGGGTKKTKVTPIAPPVTPPTPIEQVTPTPKIEAAKQPDTVVAVTTAVPIPATKAVDTLTTAELTLLKTPVAFEQKGDTSLTPAALQHLDKIVTLLQAHPGIALEVQGHTCDIGNDPANERIGLARARAVVSYLANKGIESDRLHAVSQADREPLVPNTSETNRRQNRRVVFVITMGQ